jgi:F-type H+-transporting ATPase subunit alpha
MPLYKQVILLCAANEKLFMDIPPKEIIPFRDGLVEYFETAHKEIVDEIMDKKVMNDELQEKIIAVAREYKNR